MTAQSIATSAYYECPLSALPMDRRRQNAQFAAFEAARSEFSLWPVLREFVISELDLSRDCAAPLTTYRVAKANTDGITADRGIPRQVQAFAARDMKVCFRRWKTYVSQQERLVRA
ncbi:hypothetical protein K3718_20335 (plasmid) [Leisingera aquaemixtae]|uniref:Uncharacterized protein n=1 Tax=Leisingera aquaemixtae TaxID=1396826 RepID=A0ABY5WQV7_9RHOB|nr:hypothetical protein [Leisingera aquaemixtae]UWQ43841.1 hypothetical protein K3718_20335 [Leisingera aquaemixtae]